MPIISALRKAEAGEEDQEFEVMLDYMAILKLFWTIGNQSRHPHPQSPLQQIRFIVCMLHLSEVD